MADNINHPSHYQGTRECIEVMRDMFGDFAVMDFCRCNSFKYRFRAGLKEGTTKQEDIKKAEWYENYLHKLQKERKMREFPQPISCYPATLEVTNDESNNS